MNQVKIPADAMTEGFNRNADGAGLRRVFDGPDCRSCRTWTLGACGTDRVHQILPSVSDLLDIWVAAANYARPVNTCSHGNIGNGDVVEKFRTAKGKSATIVIAFGVVGNQ